MSAIIENMRLDLKEAMTSGMDFVIGVIANLIAISISVLFIHVIYSQTVGIPSWSYRDMLALVGTVELLWTVFNMFFNRFDVISWEINDGEFDIELVRPVSIVKNLLLPTFRLAQLSNLVVSVVLIMYGAAGASLFRFLVYMLYLAMGMLIIWGYGFLIVAVAFKTVWVDTFWSALTVFHSYSQYPLEIFSQKVRKILTYIIPTALFGYFPTLALVKGEFSIIPFIVAPIFFIVCANILNYALRIYTSAGG